MREIGRVSILLTRLLWHRLSRHWEVLKPSLGYLFAPELHRSGFLRDMHCLSMLCVPTIGTSLVACKSCSRWKAPVATSAAVYIQFKPPHLIIDFASIIGDVNRSVIQEMDKWEYGCRISHFINFITLLLIGVTATIKTECSVERSNFGKQSVAIEAIDSCVWKQKLKRQ